VRAEHGFPGGGTGQGTRRDGNDGEHDARWARVPFAAGAMALGVGASALLTRRLNRLTHGLEPHELTELLYEREAVLHGIGEGMLAVDAAGRVSPRNDEAECLLGKPLPVGAAVSELDLSPVLVVNSRAVRR
jgi:sensor histidine kinase regulating citrate/malate metabolism